MPTEAPPAPNAPDEGPRLDRDLQVEDIARLTSVDGVAAFLHDLGYPTGIRTALEPEGLGLGSGGPAIRQLELLSQSDDELLQVIFVQLHSVTAKARADLVRALGRGAIADRMLILTSDFETLEFVLIEKETAASAAKGKSPTTKLRHRVFVVPRRWPQQMLRIVRRLTWTMDDGLRQYDKLRGVFDAAHFSGTYFINRALFSDHYLETRLREDAAWSAVSPGPAFESVRRFADRSDQFKNEPLATMCQEFYDPLWSVLGFRHKRLERTDGAVAADYELRDTAGTRRTVALTYPWERWLDGPDPNDPERPTENPGAAVVTLLEQGDADWVIVTNGRYWRLYSRAAHSRSTNFYEVDLPDVLIASGLSDPNEAFRYWWLFFRLEAFLPVEDGADECWLDTVARGSREYASEVEEELKRRVFYDVVPALAHGFLHDRRHRLKKKSQPNEAELERIRAGTLTLLYRLLFLLYAESRDLLPVREAEYYKLSLKSMKEEIEAKAGIAESEADAKLATKFTKSSSVLYDRLADPEGGLFAAMANGRPKANVPRYNGGLFRLDPAEASDEHEADIAEFLNTHKAPDYFLALAIDRLARVEDQRTTQLAFVDYKSLGVRQLGSIYEGLLEFKLRLAPEDLAVADRKKLGGWISLSEIRAGRRRKTIREIKKGEPYLVRDKAERKATGSYYTPDHIVEYIVENTVGPVLKRKTEALRDEFRKAEKTYHTWLRNAEADPRIMLGWRPEWGDPLEGGPGKPTTLDRRRFAMAKTHEAHKGLVEKLFDLKVLDPAMGSGHFLVEAVDYITDELLAFLNAFPVNPVSAAIERTREAIVASLDEQGIETDELIKRQLTDVHLLKRHVLKRCIYGVDLNPLATELAKVSLWLDAFTLGAPLSFLDHHLRTGNSLIGSTVEELERLLQGQLFTIDKAQLERAVQSVLTVARLADATANEVAESKLAFDQARRTLVGYRILLDILIAKHFGLGEVSAALLEMAPRLDFTSPAAFISSFEKEVAATRMPETEMERFLLARGVEVRRGGVRAEAMKAVEALAGEHRLFHWDLEFPEVFYELTGVGGGRVRRRAEAEAGFDAVIGNPPYDVLSELELGRDLSGFKAYIAGTPALAPSQRGKNNLYKLFVCRALDLLGQDSYLGLIVPMTLLGDRQTADIRKALLSRGAFTAVEAFPQKDDCDRRIFRDAKLATATFVFASTQQEAERCRPFISRQHVGNRIEPRSASLLLTSADIPLYDPANAPILTCPQVDWDIAIRLIQSGRMGRLGDLCTFFQGEVNETVQRSAGSLRGGTKLVTRGAAICLYLVREASQGEDLLLNVDRFLESASPSGKAFHHQHKRVVLQESSAQNNFRRLIAALLPAGEFCNHTINYCPEPSAKINLYLLLALLNSKLADWYFRLGSTNAHVNQYQLDALPFPIMSPQCDREDQALRSEVVKLIDGGRFDDAFKMLAPSLATAPFPASVAGVLIDLVKRIIRLEQARGPIARTDRSALAEQSQPLQLLIDRIIFALAGLNTEESLLLEHRLSVML